MRPESARRLDGVDVLRGLSILAVVLHHINLRIRFNKSDLGALLPDAAHRALFWSGSYGVKVFFVISGFLITRTILARWGALPAIDVKRFYRLRAARILPCLLALAGILTALHLAHTPGFTIDPSRASLAQSVFAVLTLHVNVLETQHGYLPACWDVLWSLSVEEVFYLVYPLVCRFVRWCWVLALSVVILLAIGPFARTIWAPNDIGSDYLYLANLDGIALGCAVGVSASHWREWLTRARSWWFAVPGASLMLLVVVFRGAATWLRLGARGLDVTVLEIGTAVVILAVVVREHATSRATRANIGAGSRFTALFRWYGRNSYEVYLTHSFFVICGTQLYHALGSPIQTAIWWFLGITAASGACGFLVAKYFSEPLNRRLRA